MFAKRRHQVPGLNTTSTADISFMLLIFFLVTTNMDVDKGLTRQLPPPDKQEQQVSQVEKGTLMNLNITKDNTLLVDGKPTPVNKVGGMAEAFVKRVGRKHLVKIEVAPEANYDIYFQVQNQLVSAYSRLRNEVAMKTYGKPFAKLSDGQRSHVKDICPQRIAEDDGQAAVSIANAYGVGEGETAGTGKEEHP